MFPEQENISKVFRYKTPSSEGVLLFNSKYMINKKQYRYIGAGLIILIFLGVLYFRREKEISLTVPREQNYILDEEKIKEQIPSPNTIKIKDLKSPETYQNIKISLVVKDKSYGTELKEGSSVFDAMQQIEKENLKDNQFSFKYTENSGLGIFIKEINGNAGSSGKYWIYYVNDKKAQVGVSKYILKEGDIIRWNQEGI